MITIRFSSWISGKIVNLQQDTDIQELASNENRLSSEISDFTTNAQSTVLHVKNAEKTDD